MKHSPINPLPENEPDQGLSFDSKGLGDAFDLFRHSLARIIIPGVLLRDVRNSREHQGGLEDYLPACGGELLKLGTYGLIAYGAYLGYHSL